MPSKRKEESNSCQKEKETKEKKSSLWETDNSVKAHLHNALIPWGMWEHQLCLEGKEATCPSAAQTKDGCHGQSHGVNMNQGNTKMELYF